MTGETEDNVNMSLLSDDLTRPRRNTYRPFIVAPTSILFGTRVGRRVTTAANDMAPGSGCDISLVSMNLTDGTANVTRASHAEWVSIDTTLTISVTTGNYLQRFFYSLNPSPCLVRRRGARHVAVYHVIGSDVQLPCDDSAFLFAWL